jgi:hypothetical protein
VFQHVAISRHIGPDERGTAFGIIGVELRRLHGPAFIWTCLADTMRAQPSRRYGIVGREFGAATLLATLGSRPVRKLDFASRASVRPTEGYWPIFNNFPLPSNS